MELTTAYKEENNPQTLQAKIKDSPIVVDPSFIEDLGYGMHNTVGLGIGIDRLVMHVLGLDRIRDGQVFPHF